MSPDRSDDPPPPFSSTPASGSVTLARAASPADPAPPAEPSPSLERTTTRPPEYTAPPTDDPHTLVPHTALVAHLSLLSHFSALRSRVLSSSDGALARLAPSTRWSAFLRLATYQLEVWLSRVCARDGSHGPGSKWERGVAALPVEAALVWWAWMVGAGGASGYEEDVRRCWGREMRRKLPGTGGKSELRDFPVVDLVDRLEGRLSTLVALRGRQLWEAKTGDAAWDLLEMLEDDEARMWVECPWCGEGCELPLLTPDRTGFCDTSFSAPCPVPTCNRSITRETLGISRLLEDCLDECPAPREGVPWEERDRQDWERRQRTEEDKVARKLIGGSLSFSISVLNPSRTASSRDLVSAALTTQDIQRVLRPLAGPAGRLTGRVATLDKVERALFTDGALPARVVRYVLSCYTTPHSFASDVALGAARLSALLDALKAAGWLVPGFAHTEAGREVLDKAARRYELFLSLASKVAKEGPALVPVDIDCVWITHMLSASRYQSDVVEQAGVFLDRAPAVEESLAATQFDRLAKLWEETLHIPLSFVHSAPSSRNPLKRLLHPSPSSALSPLATHPLPACTAASTSSSVLVHVEKQSARRRKRREGKSGAFLRGAAGPERGDLAGSQGGEDVWVLGEREAKRAGSAVVGVDGFLAPTALLGFSHARTYTPFRETSEALCNDADSAVRHARQASEAVRLLPGR